MLLSTTYLNGNKLIQYIKNETFHQYIILSIPSFIKTKLYLEYKVTEKDMSGGTLDDQLVLSRGLGIFPDARFKLYNNNNGAVIMWFTGSGGTQVTKMSPLPNSSIIGMAIDYTANTIKYYKNGTLIGTVTAPVSLDTYNYRTIYFDFASGVYSHAMTIYQYIFPSNCSYVPSGYKTLAEFFPNSVVCKNEDKKLYWYL